MTQQTRPRCGFTLVELLVTISIIVILAGLFMGVASRVKESAMAAQEVAAAKNLTTGLLLYAGDNRNDLLPGLDRSAYTIELPDGREIAGEPAVRYPWRLAPYVGNTAKGTFVVDVNRHDMAEPEPDDPDNIYHISLAPALGYNGYILGGYIHSTGDGTQLKRYFEESVVRKSSMDGSMPLIAFASARSKRYASDAGMKGNHLITPPYANAPGASRWGGNDWDEEANSEKFGHVDLRYGDRAVVARLDGSIEMMGAEQLKDMRNWCPQAREHDDPKYTINYR